MYKILIADDEKKIREFMAFFLKKEGYEVIEVDNGQKAVEVAREEEFALIILDIMMPKMNGFEACEVIRTFSTAPIIMITAVEGEEEQVMGYTIGADDYITKPFMIKVLLAKINRILEKNRKGFQQYGVLKLNTNAREVRIEDKVVDLAPKEYELLLYMLENKNIALSRNQIVDYIWGVDFAGGTRVVDNHIKKIRQKLYPFSKHIKTVMNYGYKLDI